jgi:hypothetical protein
MPEDKRRWPVGQCPVCLGWGQMGQYTCCAACSKWRRAFPGQAACQRCSRVSQVSLDGLCRPCLLIVRSEDPRWLLHPEPGRPLQLAFLLPGVRLPRASSLVLPANRKDKQAPAGIDTARLAIEPRRLRRTPPTQAASPHLVDPAQGILFNARRDWSFLNAGELDQLPALTPAASALVGELGRHARAAGWTSASRNNATKTLRILLAWLGADAPVPEADIRALHARPSTTIRRVLAFLRDRGMVIPDPARPGTAVERTINHHIDALPGGIAGEVRQWVKVVRGQGRRAYRELPFSSVRSYLNCLCPVPAEWGQRVTSLHEITRDDVQEALGHRPGVTAHNLLPALRSLFRALKQERVIFRDPARGITLPSMRRLPAPIPADLLRGLIDRAGIPVAKVAVALIAIHGLGKKDNPPAAGGPRPAPRPARRPPPHRNAHRLPRRAHPHAHHRLAPRTPPPLAAHREPLPAGQQANRRPAGLPYRHRHHFSGLGLTPSKVRQDRILDEARHTADPVHLMRVFGLSAHPAMKYVQAAHPDRGPAMPR